MELAWHGADNALLFSSVHAKLDTLVDATQFVGRAPQQVTEFIAEVVDPILTTNELVEIKDAVNV